MKTEFQQIREHVLNAGSRPVIKHPKDTKEILRKNWYPKAIKLAQNRMIQGPFRYGYFRDHDQPKFDRIASIVDRMLLFMSDNNLEHLADVMNLCGMEIEKPNTPGAHFTATDDGYHTTV